MRKVNGRWTTMPSDGKSSHWQGDLKRALNAFLYKSSLASLKDSDGVKSYS
jgi:hypothetical protein